MKFELALFNDSWVRKHPIWQIERDSKDLYKIKGVYRQKGVWKWHASKEWIISGKITFLGGQERSVGQNNSLEQTSQFQIHWLKVIFLGEAETTIRLSIIKYWFAGKGLSQVTPLGACVWSGAPDLVRSLWKRIEAVFIWWHLT